MASAPTGSRAWRGSRRDGRASRSVRCGPGTCPGFARPAAPGWPWCPASWRRRTCAQRRRRTPRRGEPALLPAPKLCDVPQVLAVGPREQVAPVRSGHEVQIRDLRRVQRGLEAPTAGGVDRPRRETGVEVGVVGRRELIVLLVEPAL